MSQFSLENLIVLAERGDAEAQCELGHYYSCEATVRDFEKAVYWFERSAAQGDALAKFNLSICYERGEGVEQNRDKANALLIEAGMAGDARSQYYLGYYYQNGMCGFPLDWKQAFLWFRKGAVQGDEDAQFYLAYAYECGQGTETDYKKALYWYRRAAKKGVAAAVCNLGYLYEKGYGVPQDVVKANEYYRLAAEQDDEVAMFNLGESYELGRGVEQDIQKAIAWYEKAASYGDEDAIAGLARLKK